MMERLLALLCLSLACFFTRAQAPSIPHNGSQDKDSIMSHAYWSIWNDDEQARIDADIDANRKADAVFRTGRVKKGTTVKVEQISSEFVFGASSFNWNQLGSKETNDAYKALFGTLFNRATVPFYWKTLEMIPGNPRFRENVVDGEGWWNTASSRKCQPHWRRPATDPIVDWCTSHGVAVHGHPLVWGSRSWQFPEWLQYDGIPASERKAIDTLDIIVHDSELKNFADSYEKMTEQELASILPSYIAKQEERTLGHAAEVMERYRGRIQSWDVVNESAFDFGEKFDPSLPMWKSFYGVMFADYPFKAFKTAESHCTGSELLNINDYNTGPNYCEQVRDLLKRGARIDVIGSQLHLFNPGTCLDIAAGRKTPSGLLVNPDGIRKFFTDLGATGVPTCISEITITSPGSDARGEMIQAIIARNLYRLWFSLPSMMGITWWNIVDDCGAPGEPSVSGLFHRDMTPKISYFALEELILHEWRTSCELEPDRKGMISWRGFKGNYRITWTDPSGKVHNETREIK